MSNPGAKPTGAPSATAIVRYGFNRALRAAVMRRDARTMAILALNYDRETVEEICALCDLAAVPPT